MIIAIRMFGVNLILTNYETDYLSNLLHEFRKSEAIGIFTTIVGSKLVHNSLAQIIQIGKKFVDANLIFEITPKSFDRIER